MSEGHPHAINGLDPEKVAYWYFRLNGFLQIENFVVHPEKRGGQRTDADLLGVRFPNRAERLIDDPRDTMADDELRLGLSCEKIDVVIVEVKTNQPCALNGPWTNVDRQNIPRVLAAIGCLRPVQIKHAAGNIYRTGCYAQKPALRVRLVAVGRERSKLLAVSHPSVTQLVWTEMLEFIWNRFRLYQKQKSQVDQWDMEGLKLKYLAENAGKQQEFIDRALQLMGVHRQRAE